MIVLSLSPKSFGSKDSNCLGILHYLLYFKKYSAWDFLSGSVVKTSPSNAGGAGLIPGQGGKISHASSPKKLKHKNRNNIATNLMKTLKTVHIKENQIFKNKNLACPLINSFLTKLSWNYPNFTVPIFFFPEILCDATNGRSHFKRAMHEDPTKQILFMVFKFWLDRTSSIK